MTINKKLIHFKSKENFEREVANENILDTSICFIQDSKEISTHGTVYKTVNWSILENKEKDYSKEYFTVVNKTISPIVVAGEGWQDYPNTFMMKRSTDDNWHYFDENEENAYIAPGESAMYKANFQEEYLPNITILTDLGTFNPEIDEIIVQGNIASLVYGDNFVGRTDCPKTTGGDFINFYSIKRYSALRRETIGLFQDCIITDASNLVLPFMDFAPYNNMFSNCFSLKKAPKILPLKKEHENYGVDYSYMFYNCSSLEESPIICAESFVNAYGCCSNMFVSCSKLRKITMLATNFIYGTDSYIDTFYRWVEGVAPEGVFIKNKDVDISLLPIGYSGIPEGWTIEDYKE